MKNIVTSSYSHLFRKSRGLKVGEVLQTEGLVPLASSRPNKTQTTESSLITTVFSLAAQSSSAAKGAFDVRPLILYEDNHMLILYKPPQITLNPGSGQHAQSVTDDVNMLSASKYYLQISGTKLGNAYLAPCHFVDRPASGVVVTAKTSKAARRISRHFRERSDQLRKEYVCVVHGHIMPDCGTLDHWLRPLSNDEIKKTKRRIKVEGEAESETKDSVGCVSSHSNDNKTNKSKNNSKLNFKFKLQEAHLTYRVLQHFESAKYGKLSLVHIDLNTGRKHQIRAQLGHIGHSVVGDTQYNTALATSTVPTRVALHAIRLTLPHPVKATPENGVRKIVQVAAAAPDYWGIEFGQLCLEWINDLISDSTTSTSDNDTT